MKRFILILTTGLVIPFANQAQQSLSLNQAISLGLENNFSIKIARGQESIDENNQTFGNAGFMPVVDLSVRKNYIRQNVDLEILGAEGSFNVKRDWAKSDQFNSALGLGWVFFDGAEMFHSYNRLGEVRDAGALNTRISVENAMALISEAYYRIVLEQARLKVYHQIDIFGARQWAGVAGSIARRTNVCVGLAPPAQIHQCWSTRSTRGAEQRRIRCIDRIARFGRKQ